MNPIMNTIEAIQKETATVDAIVRQPTTNGDAHLKRSSIILHIDSTLSPVKGASPTKTTLLISP